MRREFAKLPLGALAAALILSGCGGGDGGNPPPPPPTSTPGPTPSPSPTPTPTPPPVTTLSATKCVTQEVAPGIRVADLVIPDTLKLDLTVPAGFPNGRRLQDPVIDITLGVIFLDLTKHSPGTLASVPVNPSGNDRPFRSSFPYLAPANGGERPPGAQGAFQFRQDPASAYTRVDRMGMPAVATALISTSQKDAYNDDSPAQDATGKWAPEIVSVLGGLVTALQDDFTKLGLSHCGVPG